MSEAIFGKNDNKSTLVLTIYTDAAKSIAKDVSSASAVAFIIKDPLENVISKSAAFNTDGTDGKVKVTFDSADLDTEGIYEVQVKLTGTPWSGQSSTYEFEVRETLEVTA